MRVMAISQIHGFIHLMAASSALRFDRDLQEWYDSMTPEEREETFGSHDDTLTDEELLF